MSGVRCQQIQHSETRNLTPVEDPAYAGNTDLVAAEGLHWDHVILNIFKACQEKAVLLRKISSQEKRRSTRKIHVGHVPIGGDAPIAVQSMTNTDTRDISGSIRQIEKLSEAGCEIVRLAIPD